MAKSFTQTFSETLQRHMRLAFPNIHPKSIEMAVKQTCKQTFVNPKVSVDQQELLLTQFISWVETNNPIMSGFGTLYRQHKDMSSLLYVLIEDLGTLRKKAKKEMFNHINDEDPTLKMMFNTMQLTYKLLMNSLYGATIEKSSFFFNPYFGPSVTYTGVIIITTSLNIFEKFMSNNFHFRKLSDITTYVDNIIHEEYNPFDYVEEGVEHSVLVDYLYDKLDNRTSKHRNIIKNIVDGLDDQQRTKVYLKSNLYATIDRSTELQRLLKNILGNEDFLDPNEPPEKYMEDLTKMWDMLNTVVHYDYLDFYRYENAEYGERKTILTVDTDSNFLYLYPFFAYCRDKFGVTDDDIRRMTTTNLIMYILTSLITKCYETLTKVAFRIEDPTQRKIIAMKNEFYYKRIMLTNSKKNYAGIVTMQEGNIMEKPKVDIKGLAIKKVSTNKKVRAVFTSILNEDILSSDVINVASILGKYGMLEEEIRNSLKNGEIIYATPGRVNSIDSYVDPYTQQTVRGSIIWNELYPEKEIVFPDKINFVKLKDYSYEQLVEILNDMEMSDDERNNIITSLENAIYKEEGMAKYGFKILCMPKSITKIPDWIVPLLDVETMIENHMKPGFKLLESLDFKILSYQVGDNKGETMSNIVSI